VSIGAHQLLFVRGSAPGLVAIRIFFLTEVRNEPEDLPAHVGGVAILAPIARIRCPSSFRGFFFSFSFTTNLPFFDRGLGEGPLICVL
jgi:hypothetical protein